MKSLMKLPTNFYGLPDDWKNANLRFKEATEVAERVIGAGVEILSEYGSRCNFLRSATPCRGRFEAARLCQWLGRSVLSIAC